MIKIFDSYINDLNTIIGNKTLNTIPICESFSFSSSNKLKQNSDNLVELFGQPKGYLNNISIGNHPDFKNLKKDEQEKHYCVSMFIDIKGSTNLALKYHLDQVRLMKDKVISLCIYVVKTFGGHVQRLQGDGLYVQFVGKKLLENDAIINSLNASSILCHFVQTDLADFFNENNVEPLKIKIGIDFGDKDKVLWSYYGIDGCDELTTTSIHTDLAAKLQSKAGSNEIRIGNNIKEKLDLPDEFLNIPYDNGNEMRYIKNVLDFRYNQYIFNWLAYLNYFDFIKKDSTGKRLELYKPDYKLICEIDEEKYNQNLYSVPKGKKIKYTLFLNDNPFIINKLIYLEWNIYNRGKEAKQDNKLIFLAKKSFDSNFLEIDSSYLGHHYVECKIKREHSDNKKVKFGIFIQ